jgi:uncharacterized membrane protein
MGMDGWIIPGMECGVVWRWMIYVLVGTLLGLWDRRTPMSMILIIILILLLFGAGGWGLGAAHTTMAAAVSSSSS